MKITFRQVDAFRTVVSTGTVTEAAAMLGISQPAVSRLISDFEAEVGFKLFQRAGRVLVPTEEARLLVEEVRQAVSGMEHIKETAAAISTFGHARLSLVVTPAGASQLAPDLIGSFAAACPRAMTRMEIASSDDAVEWMVSQNYDFGITTAEPANPSFDSIVIQDSDVFCVVPTGHALSQKPMVQARDLAGESFISYMPSSRFRFEIDQFFEAKEIARQMQYETRTTDAICRLVSRGLGVSVVGSGRDFLDTIPGCVALPFAAPLNFRAVLFWSRNKPVSAVGQTFLDLARAGLSDG
ncbi:LysR substrate-binding domain-containing protein [Ruegeria sp. 2012CJ41-6]|uniref:LysR substrate-binding domain-containing protein n=1 Tax=Ruegeria spongiae TaxID=2942209 RepID=A0ABT0Q6A8_9RHOB|nr:LysR substrate-binding domain-containing protein [Ruegeria spongiae]MCL6285414.1 LysR substrate-binding domain-containing protein [Ruegeria spongiae]